MSRPKNRELADELRRIFRAIEIDSAEAFAFGDRVVRCRDPLPGSFPGSEPRVRLVGHLQYLLYVFAYSRRLPESAAIPLLADTSEPASDFVAGLAAANTGRDRLDEGWILETLLSRGRVLARKGHLEEVLWPGSFLTGDGPGQPPRPGSSLRILRPRESRERLTGYYFAFGETPAPGASQGFARYYFNACATGGPPLLTELTRRLNSLQLPFSCKLPNHPALYDRRDTAVLYLLRRFRPLADVLMHRIQIGHRDCLDDDVPLFTRRIAAGLAVADDPGNGESLGQHRCRLLAEGIWNAFSEGTQDEDARLAAVRDVFRREGLDLDRPHLNAGSEDSGTPQARAARGQPIFPGPGGRESGTTFLDAAFSIGARLCRDAYWSKERCNWIGPMSIRKRESFALGQGALETDIYRGTAGIALFLVRLFRITGEQLFAATACGALAQAVSGHREVDLSNRASFYRGWTGLASVLLEAGAAFERRQLTDQAHALIGDLVREPVAASALDVIQGSASGIPALLNRFRRSPVILELAIAHGENLLDRAEESELGLSWETVDGHPNLCGLSHGAAGIGSALLELYRATGDERFRRAAEGAFRYERHWFDPQVENWPELSASESATDVDGQHAIAWCHGAPGIGLTRLRAFEILGDEISHQEAETALRTTARSTEEMLGLDRQGFSLCHGLAGNAAVLLYGFQVLGDAGHRALAESVGRRGIELYLERREPWPCGLAGAGESPSLMLGLAGIGHFYLRLHDPEGVPPVTLLVPTTGN